MTVVVFTGPSLSHADARPLLDAIYEPPARAGDILRSLKYSPTSIGIIDGFFEVVPAVWHKEILFAIDQGVRVLGAASMGALRAAELYQFGMEGVGAIYNAYKNGTLEDDDEVAVSHGPRELGYPVLTEPMVNIRRTLSDAHDVGVIDCVTRSALESFAKALHYKERSYHAVLSAAEGSGFADEQLCAFSEWLPKGRVDQKREDALQLIDRLKLREARRKKPLQFHFERTVFWNQLTAQ